MTIEAAVTAAGAGCGTHFKPVRPHRNLRSHAGVAGWSHPELTGRALAVEEMAQNTPINEW